MIVLQINMRLSHKKTDAKFLLLKLSNRHGLENGHRKILLQESCYPRVT